MSLKLCIHYAGLEQNLHSCNGLIMFSQVRHMLRCGGVTRSWQVGHMLRCGGVTRSWHVGHTLLVAKFDGHHFYAEQRTM